MHPFQVRFQQVKRISDLAVYCIRKNIILHRVVTFLKPALKISVIWWEEHEDAHLKMEKHQGENLIIYL